jgi:AraC family transcriptional regulator, regulatory protein of adaptative response / DNA-3-methyladenine glycosylase II
VLSDTACYRAVLARDARFDGRFFVGVRTTGIYCRPICPSRTPKRENVGFFPSAPAAEGAGFRACLRCRPAACPASPAWGGTATVVTRGVRLIREGALDDAGVEELASRLGVGERHLRRLFLEHIGATPIEVAQSCRAHHARSLLEETALPIADVAFASGYQSVRRFNTCMREAFGQSPTALRSATRRAVPGSGMSLELRYREPLDWEAIAAFLGARAIPGVESVDDGVYRRSFVAGANASVLEVRPGRPGALVLALEGSGLAIDLGLVERVRRLFDLGANPAALAAILGADPRLRTRLAANHDVRLPGAWDGFEMGVRAIVGQQISVAGARTILGRIVRAHGRSFAGAARGDGITHVFPTPDRLAEADLSALGLVRRRAEAIRALSRAVLSGALDLSPGADPVALRAGLSSLPGVGPWTAEYVAMRAAADPDAFPETDLGIRRALAREGVLPDPSEVSAWAEPFRPYRGYVAMLLWQSDASPKGRRAPRRRRAA